MNIKSFFIALFAAVLLQGTFVLANTSTGSRLEKQMDALGVETVFIAPGETVDDHPVWSQDGHWLAFNDMGNWISVNLNKIEFEEADWAGITIGAIMSASEVRPISDDEAQKWVSRATNGNREVSLKAGQKVILRSAGLGTQIIFRDKNGD